MKKITTFLFIVIFATGMFAQATSPSFSIAEDTYYNPFNVELSGSDIYYTLDGTIPNENSPKYTAAISISEFGKSTTIKAASYSNNEWSDVVVATYKLAVAAPVFSVKSGVYEKLTGNDALKFTTETEGATIIYNDRGVDPKTEGSKPYGALSILASKTIKAVAYVQNAKGEKVYSEVSSEYYAISPIALYFCANEVISGNKYIINNDSKIASSFYQNTANSNLNTFEVANKKGDYIETNAFNAFTFKSVSEGYTIQDAYNRYIYLNNNNGFNASSSKPATGATWSIDIDKETSQATIKNTSNNKTIAFDTQNNTFGAFETLTANHALPVLYKEIEYPSITITPEDGDTLNEFSKFIVTCENGIKYTETNKAYAYYNVGYDSKKFEFDNIVKIGSNTIEFSLDEPIKSNNEYKVVFPANVFTLAPDGIAKKNNKDIIARYTVENKDIFELTYSNPENADVTDSLQYLYFEFNQEIDTNISNAFITDEHGNEYALSISDIDSWGGACAANALCLKTDEAIATAGEYTFVLKKEYICAKENNNLTIEADITYTFTVEESLKIKDVTPNSTDTYDSVSEIIFTLNKPAIHSNITEIIVKSSDSKSYTFTKVTNTKEESDSLDFTEESESVAFTTDTPITDAGTYTFTIENNAFYCENTNSDMYEIEMIPETTFTFIVKYPTSIEGIDAEKNESTIYDLNGRQVEKITNAGIYIKNSKKVIIK